MRTISSNWGLVARKNWESFEVWLHWDIDGPQEEFEKQELITFLARELSPKIYELLQEGSNMWEVISWIQENKPDLVENLREFL